MYRPARSARQNRTAGTLPGSQWQGLPLRSKRADLFLFLAVVGQTFLMNLTRLPQWKGQHAYPVDHRQLPPPHASVLVDPDIELPLRFL